MPEKRNDAAMSVVNGAFSALAPLVILIVTYAIAGIFPFGGRLLLNSSNSEWFSALSHYHSCIMGEQSLFYSFAEGLGEDFYSMLSGGFANPFWMLTAFYSAETLHGAVSVIMLIQSAAAGLFAYLLFSKIAQEQKLVAVVFAAAYSGGSLFALGFLAPQYSGAAVFLPLVGVGVLALCENGSFVTLFLSMVLFMVSSADLWPCMMLFCAVFFVWGMLVYGDRKKMGIRAVFLVVCGGLSFASMMALLLPAWLTGVELGGALTPIDQIDHAAVGSLVNGLFPGGFSGKECAPLIFCSSIVCLMLPTYFFNSKLGLGERQVSGGSLIVTLVCMAVPALAWLWLCAADATGIIVGFGFVFCTLACSYAARSLSTAAKGSVRLIMTAWLIVMILFVVSIVLRWGETSFELMVFSSAALTLFAAVSLIVISSRKVTPAFCVVLLFCVCCECVLGGVFSLAQIEENIGLMRVEQYAVRQQQRSWVDGTVESCENGLGSPFFRVRGAGSDEYFQIGSDEISAPRAEALMNALGISGGRGFTPFTDAFFGVRYIVTGGAQEYIYPLVGSDDTGAVYMNNASMAVGFTAPGGVIALSSFSANPFTAQNELAAAAAGAPRPLFNNAEIMSCSGIGATVSETLTGAEVIRYEDAGYVRFSVLAPSDGMMYMYIDCDRSNVEMVQMGSMVTSVTLGAAGQLGYVSRGQTVDIIMTVSNERLVLDGMYFAVLDTVLCTAALEQFSASQPSELAVDGNRIRGVVSASEGEVLLTSIPYMSGWKAAVDGVRVRTYRAAGALLAVALPAGEHTFELWYEPAYFTASLVISLLSFAVGMIYSCIAEVLRRKNEEVERRLEEDQRAEAYAQSSYMDELTDDMAYAGEPAPQYIPSYANDGVDAEYAGVVGNAPQPFLQPNNFADPFMAGVSAEIQGQFYQPMEPSEVYAEAYAGQYQPEVYTVDYQETEYYPDDYYSAGFYPDEFSPDGFADPYSGFNIYQQPEEDDGYDYGEEDE